MDKLVLISLLHLLFFSVEAQTSVEVRPHCQNDQFNKEVASYTSTDIDLMDVDELYQNFGGFIILDAREKEEYNVSHIPGAAYIGYDHFRPDQVEHLDKNKPVVVYCSIGYRSEKIGKRLKKLGFTKVHNLYGSIFEWVNRGYEVEDLKDEPTKKVHTYNRKWSKWIFHPEVEKVW